MKHNQNLIRRQCRIVKEHYNLNRPVTPEEVQGEITNIKRQGRDNLDDSYMLLAAKLDVFK